MFYFRQPLLDLFNKRRITQKEIVASHDISQRFITKLLSDKGVNSVDLYKLSVLVKALGGNLVRVIKGAEEQDEITFFDETIN